MNNSYPRANRITDAKEYRILFKQGVNKKTPAFIAYKITTNHQARIGVIVSKKAAKNAVQRNRIKRLCREVFRHEKALKHEIVLVTRPLAKTLSNKEIKGYIEQCLQN